MSDVHDEPDTRLPQPGEQNGPEFDPAGDLEYDEAHGAGGHRLDVPAALTEEAERRRSAAAPPR